MIEITVKGPQGCGKETIARDILELINRKSIGAPYQHYDTVLLANPDEENEKFLKAYGYNMIIIRTENPTEKLGSQMAGTAKINKTLYAVHPEFPPILIEIVNGEPVARWSNKAGQ